MKTVKLTKVGIDALRLEMPVLDKELERKVVGGSGSGSDHTVCTDHTWQGDCLFQSIGHLYELNGCGDMTSTFKEAYIKDLMSRNDWSEQSARNWLALEGIDIHSAMAICNSYITGDMGANTINISNGGLTIVLTGIFGEGSDIFYSYYNPETDCCGSTHISDIHHFFKVDTSLENCGNNCGSN